jgi:hypothetical protein
MALETAMSSNFKYKLAPFACAIVAALGLVMSSAHANGGFGFTNGVYSHDPILGVDHVGIDGTGNPYNGDTACTKKRPILCVNVDGSSRPNYDVAPGQEFYQGWVQGHYTTTAPVRGSLITSEANGDARCAASFGSGWRMAEFHDGVWVTGMNAGDYGNTFGSLHAWPAPPYSTGGHTTWGFGHVRTDMRLWVAINDQLGNCWN